MNNPALQILLVIFGFIFTIIFFRYIFASGINGKKIFTASDGKRFYKQEDCNEYDLLLKRLKFIYEEPSGKNRNKKENFDIDLLFARKLREGGFPDIATLIRFKDDFKKLADLFSVVEETSIDN